MSYSTVYILITSALPDTQELAISTFVQLNWDSQTIKLTKYLKSPCVSYHCCEKQIIPNLVV